MSHSPLPWKAGAADEDASLIYDAEDNIVASTEDISKFSRSIETEARENANAALIVAAVNAHAELLAALRGLFSNKHLDLGDCVYRVRERELEGWEGASVKQWSDAVTAAKELLKRFP